MREVDHGVGDPGDSGTNPVTAMTTSCGAIHFPAVFRTYSVIKVQFLSYDACTMREVKDHLSQ